MKYFEDFKPGDEYISASVTITETHVVMWGALTQDFSEPHFSEEYAQKTMWRGRIAHGMLGTAMAIGLFIRAVGETAGVAFLGINSWRFVGPIRFGDTIHARTKILEARISKSQPDAGIVRLGFSVINQRGEEIQNGETAFLYLLKPEENKK